MHLQPPLHDLVTCVHAPTAVLSGADGQVCPTGAQGAFRGSLRVLSRAELSIDGVRPEPMLAILDGPSAARFVSLDRRHGDQGADPTVRVERCRRATSLGLEEEVSIRSTAAAAFSATVDLDLEVDLASVHTVHAGRPAPKPLPAVIDESSVSWTSAGGVRVAVSAPGAKLTLTASGARASWPVQVPSRDGVDLQWRLRITDAGAVVAAAPQSPPWTRPSVVADDPRLGALVAQSLDDLDSLRLTLPDRPADQFLGAGSPWFLTLFGRDSLWAARMLLPLGTELAAGTLAVLASRQGMQYDPATGEEPGKLLHEIRRPFESAEHERTWQASMPPVYYGTVDATALWVVLLHDAWRWGLSTDYVAALLPHLEAAMAWLTDSGDADGDGFLEYVNHTGHGLANQGWKDSWDAVRFGDGTIASGPIALAEVQGYAHEAAGCAAALLTAFGRPGADRWIEWADAMAHRFRASFWVEDDAGPYPAMALDGAKRPVNALTSNAGHLLGTGLLSAEEVALVAARLGSPDLNSGYGLRTMSARDGGYSPLSYHCGSVWPHDTAIAVSGLVREGQGRLAGPLVAGLVKAGAAFDGRLPELYSGDAGHHVPRPVPYPAACRPQAWAAAAAISLLRDIVGVGVDVPAGVVRINPMPGAPVGAVDVRSLTVAGVRLDVAIDRDGRVTRVSTASELRVESLSD